MGVAGRKLGAVGARPAGTFDGDASDSPFVIEGSYLDEHRYSDFLERDGLERRSTAFTARSRHTAGRSSPPGWCLKRSASRPRGTK